MSLKMGGRSKSLKWCKSMALVTIIDNDSGNLGSLAGALDFLGLEFVISRNPEFVGQQSCLILPGVGSFSSAMRRLRLSGMDKAIETAVSIRGAKILGICLGFQLLAEQGTEGKQTPGLGLIPGTVSRFERSSGGDKSLHIGFSPVRHSTPGHLYRNLQPNTHFYFVHEYRILPEAFDSSWVLGTAHHAGVFVASAQKNNVMGVQFHPEKSQMNGLSLLRNFVEAEC